MLADSDLTSKSKGALLMKMVGDFRSPETFASCIMVTHKSQQWSMRIMDGTQVARVARVTRTRTGLHGSARIIKVNHIS